MYDINMCHISHQHAFRVVQPRSSFFWDNSFHHWVSVANNSETTHPATEHTTQENEDLNNICHSYHQFVMAQTKVFFKASTFALYWCSSSGQKDLKFKIQGLCYGVIL